MQTDCFVHKTIYGCTVTHKRVLPIISYLYLNLILISNIRKLYIGFLNIPVLQGVTINNWTDDFVRQLTALVNLCMLDHEATLFSNLVSVTVIQFIQNWHSILFVKNTSDNLLQQGNNINFFFCEIGELATDIYKMLQQIFGDGKIRLRNFDIEMKTMQ